MPTPPRLAAVLACLVAFAVGAGGVLALQSGGSDVDSRPLVPLGMGASPSPTWPSPTSASPTRSPAGSPIPSVQAAPAPVPTLDAAALRRAPVPALCGHRAGRLVDGHLPGTPRAEGGVELSDTSIGDLNGDGVVEGVALISCSRGNSVEASVHLFGRGLRPLGQVEHEQGIANGFMAVSVRISDGRLQVAGYSYDDDDPRCCPSARLVRHFHLRGATARLAPAPGLSDRAVVTGDGWGNVRVGDPYMELARATGLRISLETLDDVDPDLAACVYVGVGDGEYVTAMGGEGKVRTVVFHVPGVKSNSGVGVGDTEAEVLNAYGIRAQRVPNEYVDVDDVVVSAGPGLVLRFEFTEARVVSTMHAGEVSYASLIEGCA